MAGSLEAIWTKPVHRGPMASAGTATLVASKGIAGNADQGGKRQVTVIEREVFDLVRTTLPEAEPIMRRANFMVSGIPLARTEGYTLTVGGVRILLQGETRPCHRMDEQCPGLTAALEPDWRGGAFGIVLDSGQVSVGDPVTLEPPAAR